MPRKNQRTAAAKRSERELLQAARRRFAERGYEATSLRDVAADAGVSASLVLYHFRSKEQLFTHVVDDLFDSLRKAEQLTIRATAHLSLPDQLYAYAMARLQWCRQDGDGMQILARLWQSPVGSASVDLAAIYRNRLEVNDPVIARYLATIPDATAHEFFAASAALTHEAVYAACESALLPPAAGKDGPDEPRAAWRERAASNFVHRLVERAVDSIASTG
jgi:AcrR family transcriptional regulator